MLSLIQILYHFVKILTLHFHNYLLRVNRGLLYKLYIIAALAGLLYKL